MGGRIMSFGWTLLFALPINVEDLSFRRKSGADTCFLISVRYIKMTAALARLS